MDSVKHPFTHEFANLKNNTWFFIQPQEGQEKWKPQQWEKFNNSIEKQHLLKGSCYSTFASPRILGAKMHPLLQVVDIVLLCNICV